jgi:hypothetical protein
LIQLEKLRKAKKIISRQIEFIELIQDTTVSNKDEYRDMKFINILVCLIAEQSVGISD